MLPSQKWYVTTVNWSLHFYFCMVCGLKLTRIFFDVVCLSNDINMQICIFLHVDVKNKLVHDKHSGDLVRFVKQAVGCWSLRMPHTTILCTSTCQFHAC